MAQNHEQQLVGHPRLLASTIAVGVKRNDAKLWRKAMALISHGITKYPEDLMKDLIPALTATEKQAIKEHAEKFTETL